jgi:hypothetical protein
VPPGLAHAHSGASEGVYTPHLARGASVNVEERQRRSDGRGPGTGPPSASVASITPSGPNVGPTVALAGYGLLMDLVQGWTHSVDGPNGARPDGGIVHAVDESRLGYPSRALCGVEVHVAFTTDWPPRVYDACPACEAQVARPGSVEIVKQEPRRPRGPWRSQGPPPNAHDYGGRI